MNKKRGKHAGSSEVGIQVSYRGKGQRVRICEIVQTGVKSYRWSHTWTENVDEEEQHKGSPSKKERFPAPDRTIFWVGRP